MGTINGIASSTNQFINQVKVSVVTTSSTFIFNTKTLHVTTVLVGGGGASGSAASSAGTSGASAGGGGGGVCVKTYPIALLGASAAIVIGNGGAPGAAGNHPGNTGNNSTFTPSGAGAVLTAYAGNGGSGSASSATAHVSGSGGVGGIATGGDININGGNEIGRAHV